MKPVRFFQQPLSLFLAFVMLLSSMSCYSRFRIPETRLPNIHAPEDLHFYLISPEAPLTNLRLLKQPNFAKVNVTTAVESVPQEEAIKLASINTGAEMIKHKKDVLIYLKPGLTTKYGSTTQLQIDYEDIAKIEVFEPDAGKSVGLLLLIAGAAVGLSALILLAICNCPYVYSETPDSLVFEGAMYSGAIYPQLERSDWLPIHHLTNRNNSYNLLLSNELPEVQHTNQVALWIIDHDPQHTPLIDKNGQVRWLVAPETPQAAVGFDGQSVLPQIAERGDVWQWKGAVQPANDKATDGIILTFSKPMHAERARLVVRARNAPWLQFVYGNFRDALGVYEPFVDRQYRQKSRSSLLRWMQDQDMPLSVSIEKSPGKWVTLDYFNMPGASSFREDVMEIDVSSVKTGQLKLKLEHGFRFWEIDWVALDYAPSGSGQLTMLKPVSAIDKAQHDHAPALLATDQWYLHQPFVGDQSRLVFDAAPVPAGQKRSFFLQATGYYDLKRTPTTQKPGLFALQQFKKRHALSHLSHQLWREYGSMLAN